MINLKENGRILVIRTDRLGDALLGIPVLASLKNGYENRFVATLCRSYTKEIYQLSGYVDQVISFDSDNSEIKYKDFFRLLKIVRSLKFDIAIFLYLNSSTALLAKAARIKHRIGPASKIAKFLLTESIRQRRSKKRIHEAIHGLDLLKAVTPVNISTDHRIKIDQSVDIRKMFNFQNENKIVIIHPGSGNSSLNWPKENYKDLIENLINNNINVIITGSDNEKEMIDSLKPKANRNQINNIAVSIKSKTILELALIIKASDLFFSSSTGPLHLAAALEKQTVSIYSPVFTQLPDRWGPLGNLNFTFRPDIDRICTSCIKFDCDKYNCMEKITVSKVLETILNLVNKT